MACCCLLPSFTLADVCYYVSHMQVSATKCCICCCVIKGHSCSFLPPVLDLLLPAIMCFPASCLPPSVTFAAVCHLVSFLLSSATKCNICCCLPFSVTIAAACLHVSLLLLSVIKHHHHSCLPPRITFAAVCH